MDQISNEARIINPHDVENKTLKDLLDSPQAMLIASEERILNGLLKILKKIPWIWEPLKKEFDVTETDQIIEGIKAIQKVVEMWGKKILTEKRESWTNLTSPYGVKTSAPAKMLLAIPPEVLSNLNDEIFLILDKIKVHLEKLNINKFIHTEGVLPKEQLEWEIENNMTNWVTAVQFDINWMRKFSGMHGRAEANALYWEVAETILKWYGDYWNVVEDNRWFAVVFSKQISKRDLMLITTNATKDLKKLHNIIEVWVWVIYMEEDWDPLEKLDLAAQRSHNAEFQVVVYDDKVEKEQQRYRAEFRQAIEVLEKGDFYPAIQQIFPAKGMSFKDKKKFEVLLRSDKLTPWQFFPIVQDEGRLSEVTEKLIPKIFERLNGENVEISINVTAGELEDWIRERDFLEFMDEQFFKYEIDPKNIIIELVEWEGEDEMSEKSLYTLRWLKNRGCKLALDDYWIGKSNLWRLNRLCEEGIPPDFLKIDAALVKGYNRYLQDPDKNGKSSIIAIRSIIYLAKQTSLEYDLDIKLIAEYIDNEEIWEELSKLGIDYFQGFHLGKPIELNTENLNN